MSALSIQVPFPVFQDRDGQPLENGYIWIGEPNLNPQTNPVVAYYDRALTIVAAQPLRTLNGYISRAGTPAQIYVNGVNFSILVQDSKGSMVYNFPEGNDLNAAGVVYDPAGTGAVPTTVQAKLRESVSVKDFGAVGDGVTNDTTAIQAAITASNGKELIFPAGYTFLSGPLTTSNSMTIRIDGVLKMKDTSGVLLTITASDVTVYGAGTIDLNSTQDKGVRNTGNRFHIYGLTFANMLGGAATSGSSSALSIASCQSPRVHDLKFNNIQKGTAPLPFVSQPRAMSFDVVTNMLVSDILCENVFVAAGVASVEDSTFSNITVNSTLLTVDNCFYIITSERCVFNNVVIRGWEGEPIVFSGCEDVSFFGGEISNWNQNSCGFENCTNIEIDGMRFVSSRESTIMKSRTANTTTSGVTLRNLYVKVSGTDDIIGFYNGAVNNVLIQNCIFIPTIGVGASINNRFLTLTSTDSFAITDNTFILQETSAGVAAAAEWNTTLVATQYSDFKRNTFINRTTNGRLRILGTENNLISSDGLHNQANITGSRNPNYGLTTAEPRRFFGTAIPSAGTFIRGDLIFTTTPTAGATPGWICTTAGTPGTWKAMANLAP
jgi:polygalacturonase